MQKFLRRSFYILSVYSVIVFIALLWLRLRSSSQVDVIGITREVLPDSISWPDRYSAIRIGQGQVLIQSVGNDQDPWGMYKDNVPDQAHSRDVNSAHVFHVIYPFTNDAADDKPEKAMLGYLDHGGFDHQTTHVDHTGTVEDPKVKWTEADDVWSVPMWPVLLMSMVLPLTWAGLIIRKKRQGGD
jgi:hypothetical protein